MHGIQQALGMRGWRVKRVPPSIYSAKGWCDLVAMRWGIVAFIECKSEKGKLSKDQAQFGQEVTDAGCLYIVAKSEEFVVKVLDNIEIAFCDSKGNVGQLIKPVKGMRLMSDGRA